MLVKLALADREASAFKADSDDSGIATRWLHDVRSSVARNWKIGIVLAAFLASALWVPVLTPVATTDDWGYSRSVEILLDEGHLEVFPVVAATSVFQILWGAVFALFSSNVLGAVRLSTVVISAIGGFALYDVCRRLGAGTGLSALGTATYLFNPLAFVLSYTFMTDPHFAAVLMVATACFVRAVPISAATSDKWLLAGSVAATAAILIRQQGVLIPIAMSAYLVVRGDFSLSRPALRRFASVCLIPAIALAVYLAWLRWVNGVPDVQSDFAAEIGEAGLTGTARLAASLTFFELMYAGIFVLPLAAACVIGLTRMRRDITLPGWILFGASSTILAVGLIYFSDTRRRMPYVPQFVGSGGLGPPDVRGSRPRVFEQPLFDWLTAISAIAAVVLVIAIARSVSQKRIEFRGGAGVVVAMLVAQVAGVLPPSFHYIGRGDSLDRYFLPMLPLTVALFIWAIADVPVLLPAGWLIALVFAIFAMIGTRDYLIYLDKVWQIADDAVALGARPDQIDAGAAWDGYHLYTYGVDLGIERALTRDGPWWTYFYGKASDSSYVVSSRPISGYRTVFVYPYDSILQSEPTRLLLLRRTTAPWPPEGAIFSD